MANVILCDRCGKIATAAVAGKAVYQPNPFKDYKEFILCPECSRETHQFFTGLNMDSRAILEAFDPDADPEPELPSQKETSEKALEHHVNGNDDEAYEG